jgi:hypothetical protein
MGRLVTTILTLTNSSKKGERTMEFYIKHYNQLIDYVVTGVEFEEDEFDKSTVFPILLMMHPDGTKVRVVVSCDDEGNDAGFLFVEKVK